MLDGHDFKMGFFSSNKNRMASTAINRRGRSRSIKGQNRRLVSDMMYDNARFNDSKNALSTVTYIEQPTKKQIEAQELGFLGYSLKYGDCMLVLDIEDIIPEMLLGASNLITNGVFDNIRCDKVGIVWSPKRKMFMMLALNADYTCFVLFESANLYELPHIIDLNMDILPVNAQILENINRLMNSVYELVHNMTSNPIMVYKIGEIFKR
jgi:hypothetical protein